MLLDLAEHVPKSAAEELLDLVVGATPQIPAAIPPAADPFAHPDAQRRFRVIESVEELERAITRGRSGPHSSICRSAGSSSAVALPLQVTVPWFQEL